MLLSERAKTRIRHETVVTHELAQTANHRKSRHRPGDRILGITPTSMRGVSARIIHCLPERSAARRIYPPIPLFLAHTYSVSRDKPIAIGKQKSADISQYGFEKQITPV